MYAQDVATVSNWLERLYDIPALVLLVVALAAGLAFAGIGQALVHRLFRREDFIEHNEVGGIMIAVSGTLYAVVLGFLTVVVWQHYIDARQLVVQESDADIDAWHSAVGLPADVRAAIRRDMLDYAKIMTTTEWPAMKQGRSDLRAAMIVMDAINKVGTFVPANNAQTDAQQATMSELTAMHDARQQRVAINAGGVAGFEWVVLLVGAVSIIAFCWLFGIRNGRMQFVMTSTVVTMIVSTLVLLFELQFPFRSDVGIGPGAWQGALTHIHEMQTGNMPEMR